LLLKNSMPEIILINGDITKVAVDAIVNAANTSLLGGGGVDGAIHRAAGVELYNECKKLNGCKIGEAKITNGYELKAKYVIHTVGPVWSGGLKNEETLLKKCYINCITIAESNKLKAIAFPNISTGVYRFPKQLAAEIAIKTIKTFNYVTINRILFVTFDNENYLIYKNLLNG